MQEKDSKTRASKLFKTQQQSNNSKFTRIRQQDEKKKRCRHKRWFCQQEGSIPAIGINVAELDKGKNKRKNEDKNQNRSGEI